MPKIIKKRSARKKAVQENEVKSAALQALDKIKQRQKQVVTGVSVVAALIILYVIFALYSSSMSKKAYSLEMEAYNVYYSDTSEESGSEEDRWKKALELYKKSVDIKATPITLFYLGNCYFNLGDYDNAIKKYNLLVDKFSREEGILPLVYQKLASAYFRTNQNDKALETLGRLAVVDKGVFKDTALILEAGYYEGAGEKEKALEKYREILTEFPVSPWSTEASSKVASEEAENRKETTKETEVEKEEKKVD
ncbi:MAG TPA: tetratricopeptide repeat protein [Nitrospirae bacterium]|nr:tetratricopeptide repeat protein [Nitrospirota bacterium]